MPLCPDWLDVSLPTAPNECNKSFKIPNGSEEHFQSVKKSVVQRPAADFRLALTMFLKKSML